MSSHVHVWQVTWPFGIKGATLGGGLVLTPETFKRLGHSKHTQVAMLQVHPYDWSLLPSTVSDAFTCVSMAHVLTHALKYFREAWECCSTLN